MTENMKIWLRRLYLEAAEEHRGAAQNEHLWALGSDNNEMAVMHEQNAEENREFAKILREFADRI